MGQNNHVSEPLIDGVNVMITWDTEYYSENDVDNIVLSSQFCVVYHDTVKNIKFIKSFMIWHKNGFRLSFSEMVSICLKKVGVKYESIYHKIRLFSRIPNRQESCLRSVYII